MLQDREVLLHCRAGEVLLTILKLRSHMFIWMILERKTDNAEREKGCVE